MKMKTVTPQGTRKGGGHYVPGVISNGMLYISGQLPVDPETGVVPEGGVSAQARMALANVERILLAAGLSRENVVQCRVYVPDVEYWDEVNAVYAEFFGAHKPARVVVPSRDLHGGALVEIEAIAEMKAE
jgi:2-iminobutanoate/2-iminopropanoate deaminase